MSSLHAPQAGVSSARLAIEYKNVKNLAPNPNNPRIHTERQIRKIARSIEEFGFVVPVVIRPSGEVVAGHGRVQAARLLHLHEIPTVTPQHLSESQLTALMLADNQLCEQSEWNPKLLAEQLKTLSEVDLTFSLETTGFETSEIDLLIESLQPHDENDRAIDSLPKAKPGVQVTVPGDLWALGRNRVFCGDPLDARSYLGIMEGQKANLVLTSPPHAGPISGDVGNDFLIRIFGLLVSQTIEDSIHFIFADWRHMSEVLTAGKQLYRRLTDLCVWTRPGSEKGSLYRDQHELVFVFTNDKDPASDLQPREGGRHRSNVWHCPRSKSRSQATGIGIGLRPTEKPVSLVADAILDCSARNDVVLDPFLGNGTTVIAAERTGRICYGIEIDPNAVDTIIRRWQTFTGLAAKHATSGKTFREREKEVAREFRQ